MTTYADILIDHPYSRKQGSFTYTVPESLTVNPGDGVAVPFQKSKKAGLVLKVHSEKPSFEAKAVLEILEPHPLLEEWQIKLAHWISEYYFCSLFDSIRLFLPKNIFRVPKKKRSLLSKKNAQKTPLDHPLTKEQAKIIQNIQGNPHENFLIQGVTGSGKTEIYKELIKKCIQNGGQALFLVPEISLTPQFLAYLSDHFPKMAVVHSKVSEGEKARVWNEVKSGEIPLILGSRSALFCPFKNLKLIILDEEHEWSYKQDQSPRYHARDLALKMAALLGAQVVMGSATPSVESRYATESGNVKRVTLKERIHQTALPEVTIVDMREELKKRNFTMFSDELEQKIRTTIEKKEQVILFLNRRGSASSTLCRDCGTVAECPYCLLPFTFHARNFGSPRLICHHCGKVTAVPETCPKCHGTRVKQLGTGTEKVETELQKLFPTARIARVDKDTMGKKDSFSKLHAELKTDSIDILIGTQMIGKGWDLPKVSLVGIVLADLGLSIPDFRTTERMFQLLTQVAGRAGRREKQGTVLIQTYNPDFPLFEHVKNHDYDQFYEQEIESRKSADLPPFSKLAKLMILENTEKEAMKKAEFLKKQLEEPGYQIFSAPAFLPRVKGKHQWNLLIQGQEPRKLLNKLTSSSELRIDIDPLVSI